MSSHYRAVRIWLLAVAALIFAMVIVGGATRLTESGLSITEWQPLAGSIPPLSETQWQDAFEKYQATTQYQKLNRGMSLAEFKTIYWWEWTHRLLGRVVGIVFLLPFLWFLFKGAIGPPLRGWLWTIFGLGALQGVVGWWMVVSGLTERVSVSQYRLAFHLTLACTIFAAVLWTAQRLQSPIHPATASARTRASAVTLLGLVLCQIYFGALVAGLRAGLLYNTWPLIDGSLVPKVPDLFFLEPWWRNVFENPLTVQFLHRSIGYVLFLAAIIHAIEARRSATATALALAVFVQAALGITTLLYQAPLGLALLHQTMAIIVLAVAVIHAERLTLRRRAAPATRPAVGAA
jgi:cytochrome c oxidase assembly protein subunit 15